MRLQRAEVHAAVSLAGLAAALAAVASENAGKGGHNGRLTTKETAVASAAAVVAAQCAQMAETMGANRDQLSTMIGSAMTGTSVSEILTLTASATTCKKTKFLPSLVYFFYESALFLIQRCLVNKR